MFAVRMVVLWMIPTFCLAQAPNFLPFPSSGPSTYKDPKGRFEFQLAPELDCEASGDNIDCTGNLSDSLTMVIEVATLGKDTTLPIVALNQLEDYEKRPNFRQLTREKKTVDGREAILQVFAYSEFKNVQLTIQVQFFDVVVQDKLYKIKVECGSATCDAYQSALKKAYSTLKFATPSKEKAKPGPVKKKKSPPKLT